MNNFYFYNPTKILFGRGMIARIVNEIPKAASVLVAYGGGSIKQNGIYAQVMSALTGYTIHEFGGITANPEYTVCLALIDCIKTSGSDYLLAVGGGSVIDATKFAALACHHTADPWTIMLGQGQKPSSAIPIGCIQTFMGTGSEANNAFVISRQDTQEKLSQVSFHTFPKFAVLDPETIYSMPADQLAHGIVDTFVHVLEQYATFPTSAIVQERQAEAVLLTILDMAPKIAKKPLGYDICANLLWCANQASNSILSRGVATDWATHNIGHVLTALFGLAHAQTLAIVIGGLWRNQLHLKQARLCQYGRRVWGLQGSDNMVAEHAIEKTEEFFESLGIATRLSAYGLDAVEVATSVASYFEKNTILLGEHKNIGHEQVYTILLSQR